MNIKLTYNFVKHYWIIKIGIYSAVQKFGVSMIFLKK